jgi:Lanthionine synthetase C-like protein/Protein kinase domain
MNLISQMRRSTEQFPVDEEFLGSLHVALRKVALEDWRLRSAEAWCYVEPPAHNRRMQGWKLHISATPSNVVETLERTAEVLVAEQAAFKFARTKELVEELNGPRCPRGNSGKVITVYPEDDDHLRRLAEALHHATEGLVAPAILSDRPYRPGGVVYYRYGGFMPTEVLDTEGSFAPVIVAPDGSWVKDARDAWFSPPAWAPPPFPDTPAPKPPEQVGRPVLLSDRYVVRAAIRHSNRGGVYRAEDTTTGDTVILKQARPHVGTDRVGQDAQDRLRYEADMLSRFEPLGITPRNLSTFTHMDHLFLAQEEVVGDPMRHWVEQHSHRHDDGLVPCEDVLDVARQLTAILAAVHAEGLVVRDLSPGNIMIEGDGRVRLIDVEFIARPGEAVPRVFTPGYAAPEVVRSPAWGPAPDLSADLFSLGAMLIYLSTCMEPYLHTDDAPRRPLAPRLAAILRVAAGQSTAARLLAPAIEGLTADRPSDRWSTDRVSAFLDDPGAAAADFPPVEPAGRIAPPDVDRLLEDGVAYILDTMRPDERHLWPPVEWQGSTNDPCNVQAGAGGVVAFLSRAAGQPAAPEVRPGLGVAARWLSQRVNEGRVLPGLYFGRSGAAWALHDAAIALEDESLAAQAVRFARRLPVRWPNPDMTHGIAGAGMAQMHFWSVTGEPVFRERAKAVADSLLASASEGPEGVQWIVPKSFDSRMAGLTHFGYAHGVAGVCHFLLLAARVLGDERYLERALSGGRLLASVVEREGNAALWPSGDPEKRAAGADQGVTWWCSGSAGVGAFLLRLWRRTGEDPYRELAESAGVALRRDKWFMTPVACHGLASYGELLLDLAEAVGEARYREWAEEIAACIEVRHVFQRGRRVVTGETGRDVSVGFNVGLSGVLAFLHRLRNGGPRMWMLDDLLVPEGRTPSIRREGGERNGQRPA